MLTNPTIKNSTPRWLTGLATMLALTASAACVTGDDLEDEAGAGPDLHDRAGRASCGGPVDQPDGASGGALALRLAVTEAEIDGALANSTIASNGLPKWQSRPGATIALYLDFDGGTYGDTSYSAASLDSDKSRFSTTERRAILRAALEVQKSYAGFNVNVTTDRDKMDDAYRWGWILITNSWSRSGEAWIDVMDWKPTDEAMGIAGTSGVLGASSIDRGYLLTHELGHMFGLEHSGRWVGGSFYEYAELEESRTGDWMGGRDSYFTDGYRWRALQTEESTSTQDPNKIITRSAGRTDCLASNPECTSDCPCRLNEARDCDSSSHCVDGLVCRERGSIDTCELP